MLNMEQFMRDIINVRIKTVTLDKEFLFLNYEEQKEFCELRIRAANALAEMFRLLQEKGDPQKGAANARDYFRGQFGL